MNRPKGTQKRLRRCYACGEIGHEQWQCPNAFPYPPHHGPMAYPGKAGGKGGEYQGNYGKSGGKSGGKRVHFVDEEAAPEHGLGQGDSILEVGDWQVPVRTARGHRDMRPTRREKCKFKPRVSNKYSCLSEEQDECGDIHLIDWEGQKGIHSIGQQEAGWERISMKIDSG